MIEELKSQISKIEKSSHNDINIKNNINRAKEELSKMKRNIDNIIFCRLQKELKKNNQILLNSEYNFSEEILLLRTLTQLNIIPLFEDNKTNDTKIFNEETGEYLYFLLSKNKAKNIDKKMTPIQFWKNLIKFKDLKTK